MTRDQYFLTALDLRREIALLETEVEHGEVALTDRKDRLFAARRRLGELKVPEAGDYVGRDDD